MAHKDRVAGIGDDEKEKWMVYIEAWWHAAVTYLIPSCGRDFRSFFVNLKRKWLVKQNIKNHNYCKIGNIFYRASDVHNVCFQTGS